ncbi:MAG: hypothetical protein ABI771_06695 [Betaproteobacteria bacterium]
MRPERRRTARVLGKLVHLFTLTCALSFTGVDMGHAAEIELTSTAVLRAKYADLAPQFANNVFGRPVVLESAEATGNLRGDVYAVLRHPYASAQVALKDPAHWCDILILHLNIKYCRAVAAGSGTMLEVNIGRKSDQPIEKSYRVEFAYRVQEASQDHLAVVLDADKGPVGTRDYRILLEAVALKDGQTFMHLAYSYGYGTAARLGLMAYLGTAGSKKVGFTVTGRRNNGQAVYIDGLRGVIERNTMRYYLAIEAYLGALSAPRQAQLDKRLIDWYTAVERYPLQLHEIGQQEYLEMKRREYRRQQAAP